MNKDIEKYISLKNKISKMEDDTYELEGPVFEKIKQIYEIKRKINNYSKGRVSSINSVSEEKIYFEVSYCGCCEGNNESFPIKLLSMNEKEILKFFKDIKEKNIKEKKEKERIEKEEKKIRLEEYDRKEFDRLKNKFGKTK